MGTQALIAAGLVITNGRIAGNACKNELEESFSRKIDDFRHATDDKLNTILDCQKTTNKLMLKAAMSTMKAVDGNKEVLRLFVNEMQEVINMDGSPKKA